MPAPPNGRPNRLSRETSPYLLQHAGNPVDWYPWGPEAFEKARKEDKPVFLSIGYSACHWCHVMERESFEDPGVAAILNSRFVPVKVDREERPDLDEIYMTAVQMMTGQGGWPMSVWLTPDGRPFYGGTYFPPDTRFGRPGFGAVLEGLSSAWAGRREEVETAAAGAAEALRGALSARIPAEAPRGEAAPSFPDLADRAIARLMEVYDRERGGFGSAPKFPPAMALLVFLRRHEETGNPGILEPARRTLEFMARGGIYDQIGGGFHRYSTDPSWLVPHFEKMLYDQALLVRAYVEAHRLTAEPSFGRVARETCEFVLRELTDPAGGFYSTLDADSEGEEGKFYLWTPGEVAAVLGEEDARLFGQVYDVTPDGNWEGRSILHLRQPVESHAIRLETNAGTLRERLDGMRARLLRAREGRARPGLDDKVLVSWNGLMIGALARAGAVLGERRFTAAAERAARFVLADVRRDGRLMHQWREGRASGNAFLDDYAGLAEGLLLLGEAAGPEGGEEWRREAAGLLRRMRADFEDRAGGGFFLTSHDHEDLLARPKSAFDNAVPSGNSLAVSALLRTASAMGDEGSRAAAVRALALFLTGLERIPGGFPYMLLASLDAPPGAAEAARVVSAEALSPAGPVNPGSELRVGVRVRLAPGWHVQSLAPDDDRLLPTTLGLLRSDFPMEVLRIESPEPARIEAIFSDRPVLVHEGSFELTAICRVPDSASPGRRQVELALRAQPCDDRRCLAPVTLALPLTLEVGSAR